MKERSKLSKPNLLNLLFHIKYKNEKNKVILFKQIMTLGKQQLAEPSKHIILALYLENRED